MPFLTEEQVRAVRLKGSETIKLERLEKSIRVVLVSGNKAFEIRELQSLTDAKTPKGQRAIFMFMLEAACADDEGNLFTHADAEQLFDVLSLEEVTQLVNKVSDTLGIQVGKGKASPSETSSSVSVSPSAGPTPTT